MKTKPALILVALFALIVAILSSSFAAGPEPVPIPPQLRQGVGCDTVTVATALELVNQGWGYTMPRPKSAQAAWGNTDGRTTWYVGYWSNTKTRGTSSITPAKGNDGQYVGDGKGMAFWRRGGSPRPPTKLEWLCPKSGGIPPR